MVPSFANPSASRFDETARELMLQAAADSIEYGLHRGSAFPVIPAKFPPNLQLDGASFVTLERGQELRGCIGTPRAYRPLIKDIVENAFCASRKDDRFTPICFEELSDLAIHISVLSEPEPMQITDEKDLAIQLRPGIDGVILETDNKRGTFLPHVWTQCTDANDFIRALKRKATIPEDEWPVDLKVYRYTVESIPSE